jgi:Flp pilus assembly protein TadG
VLGPSEPRLPAERRALITDYLLGQLPARVRDDTRERLASSPAERAWARVLASELTSITDKPLPEIPSGAPAPIPEPAVAPEPVATSEPAATAATPPAGTAAATPPTGSGAATPPAPSSAPLPRPTPVDRRSSRGGGGILLAIAALIVVVAVIVIIANSGSSSPKKTGSNTASTPTTTSTATTTTSSKAHVIGEITMAPANKASKSAGIAEIVVEGKVTGVIVAADHLVPNTAHNAYAVWLSNPSGPSELLGYVKPPVGKSGVLKTSGALPADVASYKEILLTLETTTNTKTPGPTVLSGPLSVKSGG